MVHAAEPSRWRTVAVLLASLAISGFLLTTEHRAHFLGVLPWLLLLACPFLHLLMHGGHGGHGGAGGEGPAEGASDERVRRS
jgi:hypothetical protein